MYGCMKVEYRNNFEYAQEAMILMNNSEEIVAANQSAYDLLVFKRVNCWKN